jgi:hypothetical protein
MFLTFWLIGGTRTALQVAIVKECRLRALCTSKFFIKQRFGLGYQLKLSLMHCMARMANFVPEVSITGNNTGTELSLRLPAIFERLEIESKSLGVLSLLHRDHHSGGEVHTHRERGHGEAADQHGTAADQQTTGCPAVWSKA